ncbi:hypothetical protein VNI00_010212 [Paramarasmius palmivorus]|uniref:Uncharacterized protein n=1 Tax=Paramarasmius palmivorus TaxID=297713 RepID=A0AAW0CKK4_9AGAR
MFSPRRLCHGFKNVLVASVINDIWIEVLFFTLVATMVTLVSEKTNTVLTFKNSLLTVLGIVVGLVISFRTTSAYERYQEGAKMWTSIIILSRNLAQMIWIHIPNKRPNQKGQRKVSTMESLIEKRTMITLIHAFGVSVKHYVRGESGVDYEDLFPLVRFLPQHAGTSESVTESDLLPLWAPNHEQNRGAIHSRSSTLVANPISPEKPDSKPLTVDPDSLLPTALKPARIPPENLLIRFFKTIGRLLTGKCENVAEQRCNNTTANIPFEISLYLQSYASYVISTKLVEPAVATALINNLSMMQDTLSNLDRIKNTPLPFAYQVHLRMSIWIYLFFLPFQIYTDLRYLTIPATAFAAFLFLGFLDIGREIENPFDYDANDLDLDGFCANIQRELHQITAHICPEPHDLVTSSKNQPFTPADTRDAPTLIEIGLDAYTNGEEGLPPGMMSMKRTLLQNWTRQEPKTKRS